MDHYEALRSEAVEKYLLDELAAPEREEFEEHFFDCRECAADLKTTAAFLDATVRELKRSRAPKVVQKHRFAVLWRPAFVAPAFAMLLLVIVYQGELRHPQSNAAIAPLDHPEVLPFVSLIGANSRGGMSPAVTVMPGEPILLSVDIPATKEFLSYRCTLIAPSGATVWRVPVSAEQAKDTVSIRIPPADWRAGDYRLIVQGYGSRDDMQPEEVARYRFAVHVSNQRQ
jgi:hypothetical protein